MKFTLVLGVLCLVALIEAKRGNMTTVPRDSIDIMIIFDRSYEVVILDIKIITSIKYYHYVYGVLFFGILFITLINL